jgi:hypothetical protein
LQQAMVAVGERPLRMIRIGRQISKATELSAFIDVWRLPGAFSAK